MLNRAFLKVGRTHSKHTLSINIFGMKQSIKFSFSLQIMSYLGASDRPIKKLVNSPFKGCTGRGAFKTQTDLGDPRLSEFYLTFLDSLKLSVK